MKEPQVTQKIVTQMAIILTWMAATRSATHWSVYQQIDTGRSQDMSITETVSLQEEEQRILQVESRWI